MTDAENPNTKDEQTEAAAEAMGLDPDEFKFVEDPTFDIEYKGECAYEVKVMVPSANETQKADELFDELKHDVEVHGFRKGRAPRKLIERKFAKAVKGEVAAKLVSAAFHKLIHDNDLRPLDTPEIDGLDNEKERPADQPLEFTLKFEVAPRVTLGEYKGLVLERSVVEIQDEDVDKQVDALRQRFAVYEPQPDAAAEEGDQVELDFVGTIDGEEFQGGKASKYPYIVGSGRFFEEFDTAVKGAKTGEERTCIVTFPDDYHAEELRGKSADFNIAIGEIRRRVLPELNDDFVKQTGSESIEALRETIHQRMIEEANDYAQQMLDQRAINTIIERSQFEIPKTLVERYSQDAYQQEVRRLLQMRIPMNLIQEREEELHNSAKECALRDIKTMVLLNSIAEAEKIEVDDEDFESEIAATAERSGLEMDVVGEYLNENEERRSSLESRIMRTKALKIVLDNAEISEKQVAYGSLGEVEQEGDTQDDA